MSIQYLNNPKSILGHFENPSKTGVPEFGDRGDRKGSLKRGAGEVA